MDVGYLYSSNDSQSKQSDGTKTMMRFLLYALLIWFLYQLVFKLIIPVYRASRKLKQGFREMQEKMNEQYRQQQAQTDPPTQPTPKTSKGDYIDFEEL